MPKRLGEYVVEASYVEGIVEYSAYADSEIHARDLVYRHLVDIVGRPSTHIRARHVRDAPPNEHPHVIV